MLMNHPHTVLCRAITAVVLGQCLLAVAAANPYSEIGKRNSFGLLQPSGLDTAKTNTPPLPLPKLEVTGVTTIGVPRALIKLQIPANPRTKEAAREVSYIMVAGEPPIDGIQVLEIQDHADLGRVKVQVRWGEKEYTVPLCADRPPRDKRQASRMP
jgi:hypothetical protein